MPINGELFQEKLAVHSAPTLMNMKVGSLFCIKKQDIPNYIECLDYFNSRFSSSELNICILKDRPKDSLVYVYRYDQLEKLLSNNNISRFLDSLSYSLNSVEEALDSLKDNLNKESFPHEIGIFLGYPLHDVKAFMNNDMPSKCIGCWKVYGNTKNALKTFKRYNCCTKRIKDEISTGKRLFDLIS